MTEKTTKSVAAEIREEQRKALKKMNPKQKLAYFWEYYKTHVLVSVIAMAILISIITTVANAKEQVFYAMMLNAYGLDSEYLSEDFANFIDLDTEQFECYVDGGSALVLDSYSQTDIGTMQKIMAYTQVGDLDVIVSDSDVFARYTESEMFTDLRMLLSEEELAAYADHLYYVDASVIAAQSDAAPTDPPQLTEAEQAEALESHRHPEDMKDPVPVGIFLTEAAFIKSTDSYPAGYSKPPVFGVVISTRQVDNSLRFLEYLWTTSPS